MSYDEWPPKTQRRVDRELRVKARTAYITGEICRDIAARNDVTPRSVIAFSVSQGYPYDLTGEKRDPPPPRELPSSVVSSQYGVLQGTANVISGCATTWGVIILIFCIILILSLFA